jgi:hypothetical protein
VFFSQGHPLQHGSADILDLGDPTPEPRRAAFGPAFSRVVYLSKGGVSPKFWRRARDRSRSRIFVPSLPGLFAEARARSAVHNFEWPEAAGEFVGLAGRRRAARNVEPGAAERRQG